MNWRYWEHYSSDSWHFNERAVARHKNWVYEITREAYSNKPFYVFIENKKLDINYCSGWTENKKYFKTLEEAKGFCETFDYKKHFCLGEGK